MFGFIYAAVAEEKTGITNIGGKGATPIYHQFDIPKSRILRPIYEIPVARKADSDDLGK